MSNTSEQESVVVTCDMRRECTNPITHIGVKGYAYCTEHAGWRRGVERCRRMRQWEIALLKQGKALPSYEPRPKPTSDPNGSLLAMDEMGTTAEKLLRWMLDTAQARATDPKARTVTLKFATGTLRMWAERARDALPPHGR